MNQSIGDNAPAATHNINYILLLAQHLFLFLKPFWRKKDRQAKRSHINWRVKTSCHAYCLGRCRRGLDPTRRLGSAHFLLAPGNKILLSSLISSSSNNLSLFFGPVESFSVLFFCDMLEDFLWNDLTQHDDNAKCNYYFSGRISNMSSICMCVCMCEREKRKVYECVCEIERRFTTAEKGCNHKIW